MYTSTLNINEALQKRLRARAEQEQRPIEDVIIALLDEKVAETEAEHDGNLFLMLADLAEKYEPIIHRDDLSEHFDDIIGEMMAEDLRRQHEDNDGGS